MMIDLTVKTLDSQNHPFSVDDDMTVGQFKEHIADVVNIPAETQRLIYCGRVLNDVKKLSECDVNGKVVHLVHRPPPSTNRPHSPDLQNNGTQRQHRHNVRRRLPQPNQIYLGSMAYSTDMLDPQDVPQLPPSQNLSNSRLNVARRMLRLVDHIASQLENNTSGTDSNTSFPEEPIEPVPVMTAQAQIVVPQVQVDGQPPQLLSDALFARVAVAPEAREATPPAESSTAAADAIPTGSEATRESSPIEENAGVDTESSSAENNQLPSNVPRTTAMAELLDELNRVNGRIQPFMQRYHELMREDPSFGTDAEAQQAQTLFNRVSAAMHALSHAYHALSDIMCPLTRPGPRPLLCRPILVQHAVLQAGIPLPIQVEAHIDITSRQLRPGRSSDASPTPLRRMNMSQSTNSNAESSPITTPNNESATAEQSAGNTPVESSPDTGSSETTTQPPPSAPPAQSAGQIEFIMAMSPDNVVINHMDSNDGSAPAGQANVLGAFGPSNHEFIQSLVNVVTNTMMRNVNMSGATPNGGATAPETPVTATTSAEFVSASTGSNGNANGASAGQNSQARGNTATLPTTATQTRSTPRPHVHFTPTAFRGFDPYLQCNSHHISNNRSRNRRSNLTRSPVTSTSTMTDNNNPAESNSSGSERPTAHARVPTSAADAGESTSQRQPQHQQQQQPRINFPDLMSHLFQHNSVVNMNVNNILSEFSNSASGENIPQARMFTIPAVHVEATVNGQPQPANAIQNLMSTLNSSMGAMFENMLNLNSQNSTIAELMGNDESYVEGQSLFVDFMMTISREFTISDVVGMNFGQWDSLHRLRPSMRDFVCRRILNGQPPTQQTVEQGSERIIQELMPYLERNVRSAPQRPDVDLVASLVNVLRARVAPIISLLASEGGRENNFAQALVQRVRTLMRELCAIAIYSSPNGESDVEAIFTNYMNHITEGLNATTRNATLTIGNMQFRLFINNVNMPRSAVQHYLVSPSQSTASANSDQGMEVDAATPPPPYEERNAAFTVPVVQNVLLPVREPMDQDPVPDVAIGSEQWHSNIPTDWVPVITRDSQRQRRQSAQPPFSDAYLSGMPSKRRKVVSMCKPQGTLPQVISDSVRQAVSASGLTSAAPIETVCNAASNDSTLQAAYREELRLSVRSRQADHVPPELAPTERFPNATRFFRQP